MDWRRLQLLLCLIIAGVAVIRFMTGNIVGGLVSAAIAVLLFSWTTGYPLASRARRLWRLLGRASRKDRSGDR